MTTIDVNSDGLIQLTANLERLHKSSFPSAVRNTLNDAAFGMKKNSLIDSAKSNFTTIRSPRFFKRFTQTNKAKGFNVKKMYAETGFTNRSDSSANAAIDGMRKHEFGGTISEGLRYLKGSRISSNYARKVSRKNYFNKSNIIRKKRGRKSNFVAQMYAAKSQDKMISMQTSKGTFLAKVQRISKDKNGKVKSKLKFIAMSRSRTPVKISRNRFISKAANVEAKKMPNYYRDNAEFQFKKRLRVK